MKLLPPLIALLSVVTAKANSLTFNALDTMPMVCEPSTLLRQVKTEIHLNLSQLAAVSSLTPRSEYLESKHATITESTESFENQFFTFKSYPNPVDDRLLIEVNMTTDVLRQSVIELTDAAGNALRQVPCLPRLSLAVADLPQGNYKIAIKTNGQLRTSELVEIRR
jgi:hypothetical protein